VNYIHFSVLLRKVNCCIIDGVFYSLKIVPQCNRMLKYNKVYVDCLRQSLIMRTADVRYQIKAQEKTTYQSQIITGLVA
jgi:hypothetical protein